MLLFQPGWDMLQVGVYDDDAGKWQDRCGDLLDAPTYWAALPPLPCGPEAVAPERGSPEAP